MSRKKSVQLCAQTFRKDANDLIEFCVAAEKKLSDAHVSLAYNGAIINLYAAFEQMMVGALTGAINNATSHLSDTTSVQFPKHLTEAVCEYIIIGNGYFNFQGRDGLIQKIKKYVPEDHYLVTAVKEKKYKESLEQLCALRNYAAHSSAVSKKRALDAIDQQRMGSAGSWLKRQNRFQQIVSSIKNLSEEIENGAPF